MTTRDKFTEWFEDNENVQQNNAQVAPPEEATANAVAKAKWTTPKKIGVVIAILAIIAIALAIVGIAKKKAKENVYQKMAEEWDKEYNNSKYLLYYGIYNFDGEITCVVDPYIPNSVLTNEPLPKTPSWYKEGLEDCLNGNETKKALFAAKYYTVRKTTENTDECIALGMALFEHPEKYDEVQIEKCEQTFCWHLVN